MRKVQNNQSIKKSLPFKRASSGLMALEQRFMFDGAALSDATQTLVDAKADGQSVIVATQLALAEQAARIKAAEFLNKASDREVFSIFNGGQSAPDAEWAQRLSDIKAILAQSESPFSMRIMEQASQQTAVAAFAAQGPDGKPTIFINPFWMGLLDNQDVANVLIEEVGHWIDSALNLGRDSLNDEGQIFAARVNGFDATSGDVTQSDSGWVKVDGVTYQAEFASYTFTTAYQIVVDINNSTTVDLTTGLDSRQALNSNVSVSPDQTYEYAIDKESNNHNFVYTANGLGTVTINDGANGTNFSGNDVSAIGLNIAGTDYYGWISRPIKVGGQVKGFYFWTDVNFNNLGTAQADGNQDGDATVTDNRGFVLVVDKTYFDSSLAYISRSGVQANTYKVIGSSSDRVDSALNALVTANQSPTAQNDLANGSPSATPSIVQGNAALEQGYNTNTSSVITAGITGTGRVLANDSDTNGDTLSVTKVVSSYTGNSITATAAGVNLTGRYGTLNMQSDGDWVYTPDDANPTVNALRTGTLQEQFTYTVSDGKGGTATATLTVQINGSNDAPVAANDYNTAKETLTDGAGTTTFAGYDATGNVLNNDTDMDTGDSKTITGSSTSGTATGTTQASSSQSSTVLSFSALSNSIKVGSYVFWDGDQLDNDSRGSSGTVNLETASNTNITVASIDYVNKKVTLSGVVDNKTLTSTSILGFSNNVNGTSNYKDSAISGSTNQSTSIINLSTYSGTIAIGMTVSGGGLPDGTKVVDVGFDSNGNPTSVTISSTTSVNAASLTFSGSGSAGQTIAGKYGTLVLNSDGSYTYSPYADNSAIDNGDAVLETFAYSMQDAAGVSHNANLYITVYGASTSDPVVGTDSVSVYESGVGRTPDSPSTATVDKNATFLGQNVATTATTGSTSVAQTVTLNVMDNDTEGTSGQVSSYTKADGSSSTAAGSALTGAYGTLTITSGTAATGGGKVTYTVDNSNGTVNALLPGATLTETFRYKVTNTGGGVNWTTITFTIYGTNDAPVAVADVGSLSEDGTLTATGNVLTNDTDVDSGDTKTVNKAGTSSANTNVTSGTSSANGLIVVGTYGTLTIGADGTYSYELANNSSAVQNLASGATVDDVFRYQVADTNGATSTATLTFTITGANEPPINHFNGTAISSTSTTSVTTALNTAIDFSSSNSKLLSVSDADTNLSQITLRVDNGTLSFTSSPSNVTLSAATGSTITITAPSGTASEKQSYLNSALALLRYTPTTGFQGTDFLTIASKDAANAWDSDGIAITIPASFTGPTVLESDLVAGTNAAGNGEIANVTLTPPTNQTFGTSNQSGTDTYGTWTLTTGGVFTYTLTSAPNSAGSSVTRSIDVITYDQYGNSITNTVAVTITNDIPVANADAGSVTEDATPNTVSGNVISGTGSATADVAGADGSLTVVGVAATATNATLNNTSTVGTGISGSYGSITIASNGAYTYTLDNTNSTVNALATGQSLTDVFTYTIKDADGNLSQTTVTLTINGSTDTTASFVVNDVTVNEAAGTMTFTVTNSGAAVTSSVDFATANNTALSASDYTAQSGTLSFDATHTTRTITILITNDGVFEGSETFFINLSNATGGSISDVQGVGTIKDDGTGNSSNGGSGTGTNDDRVLSVNSITVNEGGAYAVFTVSANAGQTMNLALSDGTGNPTATSGTDYTNALEYWSGSAWVPYSPGFTVPGTTASAVSLYVRVAISNDNNYEGAEDFKLTATYTSGASRSAIGVATIVDDGTGTKYTNDDPALSGPVTNTTNLDDDRATSLSVTGGSYNEGSPRAVFTINATAGQTLTLDVQDVADTGKAPTGDDEGGADDSLNNAPIYYSLDGGLTWTLYTGTAITAGSVPVLVAVDITGERDTVYEGEEQFKLVVTSGAQTASAFASIFDDGTGLIQQPNEPNPDPDAVKDDDRPLKVNNIEVNENSPWAVFRVNGTAGQSVTLALQNDSDSTTANATLGTDTATQLQYFNGTAWVNYTSAVTLPAGGELLVRVAINDDDPYEGPETFQLVATPTGGSAAYGTATILDDGTGSVYPDNPTGNPDPNAPKDDDRPVRVNNIEVNENSPWAVFRVNGTAGQSVTLALQNDSDPNTANAKSGTDFGTQLQYFDGNAWVNYTSAVTLPTGGELLVRVAINDDDPYEGPETFQLSATPNGGSAAYGTATILDDGTGSVYPDNATGNPDPDAVKDDDRPLKVNNIEVNENSPWAVFRVNGTAGQSVTLALQNDNDPNTANAKLGTDLGTQLQYFNGTAWVNYTSAVILPTGGELLVRVAINDDDPYEGPETFQLSATPNGGSAAYGTATILDDGTGSVYLDNTTGNPDPSASLDDDRPVRVNNIEVNENSPWAVFRVNGTAGQSVTLALQNDNDPNTANAKLGTDLGTQLQYFNGTAWVNYTAAVTLPSGGELLVRVAINDDDPYEGPETFQLVATPSGGNAAYGTATILDDGTGNIYPDNPTGATDPAASLDDDRPLKVNNIEVNENSPWAVFRVNGTAGQSVTLALQNDNDPNTANAKLGTDSGTQLQYFNGTAWVNYTGAVNLPTGGELLVRVAITDDDPYEGPETFQLAVTPSGGNAAYGTATILDDGTGNVYPDNPTGATDPAASLDDDRPVQALPPSPPVVPPAPPAPPANLTPPPPPAPPAIVFSSTLNPVAPALVPVDPPRPLGDAVTSGSGYQIPVSETAPPGLTLYQGVTDQFVQSTGTVSRVSLPFDAFIHSNKDAVIKLDAKLADDSRLPNWVQFDPASGTFQVTPPANFKGKLDIKVVARDDDGREAVAIFQMFIGEQSQTPAGPQSRDSFSDKLRMASKRPITLVKISDLKVAPMVTAREAVPVKVRVG